MRRGLILLVFAASAIGAPAEAADRWFAYEAESAATRHRTGDVTVQMTRSVFGGGRPTLIFRRRGADLPLVRDTRTFSDAAVTRLAGATGLDVYAVEPAAGQGFAQGACDGAPRAWIAMPTPQRFRPLRLHVLKQGEGGAPALCETLDYSWRAEWDVPDRRRLPREDPAQTTSPF